MAIAIGDTLPHTTFFVSGPDGLEPRTTVEIFGGRTVALFAVPGAFTPTCDKNHLPGYLKNAAAIKAKGVDAIAVTGVNDGFVMRAWAKSAGAEGQIEFLSDGSAEFAKAIGLTLDGTAHGLGIRSQRYAMLVENGVVKSLAVEDSPGTADVSGADAMLASLSSR